MKRKAIALLIVTTLLASGCGKKEKNNDSHDSALNSEVNEENTSVETPGGENSEIDPVEEPPIVQEPEVKEPIDLVVYTNDFEDSLNGFGPRGEELVTLSVDSLNEDNHCLLVSEKTASWNGAALDVTSMLVTGKQYKITARVKCSENCTISFTTENHDAQDSASYHNVSSYNLKADTWTDINANYTFIDDVTKILFYFEINSGADFCVDDFCFTTPDTGESEEMTDYNSLYESFSDYFDIGVATDYTYLKSSVSSELINYHFSCVTPGNEFKPDYLLRQAESAADLTKYNESAYIDYTNIDNYLSWARDNHKKVRFHTLLWHAQTPDWFFMENYSTESDAVPVSRELMLKRMENYIKNIMTYINTNYPGIVYAYDVVNEAVSDGAGTNGMRDQDSLWFSVVGEDFVEYAFTYARKYQAESDKLFYNDYNECTIGKVNKIYNLLSSLVDKGLVDGFGMQSHVDMTSPSTIIWRTSLLKYASLGIEIQITELDVANDSDNEARLKAQAVRYADIFNMLLEIEKNQEANITAVTFWGLLDSNSWLNGTKKSAQYPLLFDGSFRAKPALPAILATVGK